MRSIGLSTAAGLVAFASLLSTNLAAQWLNFPAPRAADGKPDLTGVWRGAGPFYRFNIAEDLEAGDVQPWAEALFLQRVRNSRKDSPLARCLPVSLPFHNFFNLTKIVQTPGLTLILYESPNSPHRSVFTDGRDLPKDPNPAWLGYSVGRWEGDTLVVTTAGFNDRAWLDSAGHPQTESLRITERLRRRDFGHMDFEMTLEDTRIFMKPITFKADKTLVVDTELFETICEYEQHAQHLVGGNRFRLNREALARYAGTYEFAPGREAVITVD